MKKHIAIIQGQPDPDRNRLAYALSAAYKSGAEHAGHEVREIFIADLDFFILRTKKEFDTTTVTHAIRQSQEDIYWANHLVIFYPLWLGTMPALLKAFLEQVFRPGFAYIEGEKGKLWTKLLKEKSARIVITMGMPAFIYRWYFGAHSLKSLKRNILGFAGISPIKETLIGMVEIADEVKRKKWLKQMESLGQAGS